MALLGEKTAAHVDPAVRHPSVVQVLGDNRRRDQLAVGHDRVVPQFGVAGFVDGLRRDLFQFAEQRVDRRQPLRLVPQLVDDLRMVLPQRFDMLQRELLIAFLKPLEHLFQGIGRFAHRRNDDEQVLLVVDDLAQIPHSVGIPHRRTSEFIDFHVISLINLTYLPLPFAQLTAVLSRPMAAFTNLPHPNPLPWEGLAGGLSRRNRDFDRIYNRMSRTEKPIFNSQFPDTERRCSGTGTRTCRPPRRYASKWVCRRRGPLSTRCGSGSGRRPPGHAASQRRT